MPPHSSERLTEGKFPPRDNQIARFLLHLAFKEEKLQLIQKGDLTEQEQARNKLLMQQMVMLKERYYELKEQARSLDEQYELLAAEEVPERKKRKHEKVLREIRINAHYKEIAALAIASISKGVEDFELGVTPNQVEKAQKTLESYIRIQEEIDETQVKINISNNQLFPQVLRAIENNPQIKYLIIAGPPGSGKTTVIEALVTLLQNRGIVAFQEVFDRIIEAGFKLFQKPTAEWNESATKEFDRRFHNLLIMIDAQYPQLYKDEKRRRIIIIDALGYPANIKYPWHLVRSLANQINEKEGLVCPIIAEDAVIQRTIGNRQPGVVNFKDTAQLAKDLENGATADAVKAHISNMRALIATTMNNNPVLRELAASVNVDHPRLSDYTDDEKQDLAQRIAFALLDKYELDIMNWYCCVNFLKANNTVYQTIS